MLPSSHDHARVVINDHFAALMITEQHPARAVANPVMPLPGLTADDEPSNVSAGQSYRASGPVTDDAAAFRPGLIVVSHGTGDSQLHERGKHAADRLAGTAHLLARPAGARS